MESFLKTIQKGDKMKRINAETVCISIFDEGLNHVPLSDPLIVYLPEKISEFNKQDGKIKIVIGENKIEYPAKISTGLDGKVYVFIVKTRGRYDVRIYSNISTDKHQALLKAAYKFMPDNGRPWYLGYNLLLLRQKYLWW
jgi:hypothetical protein